jgi:hypothetical protein
MAMIPWPPNEATSGDDPMPRSDTSRAAAIRGWMASVMIVLPAAAGAGSPSIDVTATPPVYEQPIVAANMHCQGAVKVAGPVAVTGPHAELQARHNAIEGWRSQVSDRFGADYTQWWRARDRDVSCRTSGASVRCEALAVPCMTQGGSASMSGLGMSSLGMGSLGTNERKR